MEENKEIVDSGIVGCSEAEDLQAQVEELEERLKEVEEERDDYARDLDWANTDLDLATQKLEEITQLPDKTKKELINDIRRRLTIDNLMSKELDEWFDEYIRFYLNEV